ncbi:CpaE family protein [uncultured Sphingomonas sp.]|uniref:AAA family ATPase n=1 Tax=uncultured Sphingomonas sp. TaxID=158754 RepID=UPI0035CAE401
MNAPWKPAGAGTREPFMAFVCDDTTADAVRPVVLDLGWNPDKVNKGGLRNAVQTLSVSASPHVLFVDLSESGDPINDINSLAEVCEPGTVVIASGQVNDVRLYRDLVASGIQDYLLKPLTPDMMRDAFGSAQAMLNAPRHVEAGAERAHCSVAVIGTRGGVGASTLATSLAWLVSDKHGRSTALLDLDVHFGTGALLLDLEPGRGLTDAIENPSRIDGLFIERAMVKASEKLSVLSAEAPINSPIASDGSAFYQLQEEMRAAFEATIIDLPRAMLVQYPHLISDVQVAVLVTELTLASARDSIRVLAWLKSNAPNTQVVVVGNKMPTSREYEISRKDFENTIERTVEFVMPYDQKLSVHAAKLGKPLVEANKGSKTVAPLFELAVRVLGMVDLGESDDTAVAGKKKGKPAGSKSGFSFKGMLAKKPGK